MNENVYFQMLMNVQRLRPVGLQFAPMAAGVTTHLGTSPAPAYPVSMAMT